MSRPRPRRGRQGPPPWIGRIGAGQRWRTRREFDEWVRAVWLAQPIEDRNRKVARWAREVMHGRLRGR